MLVMLAMLRRGNYPHARAQGDFDDVEEERRVLYAAFTGQKMN